MANRVASYIEAAVAELPARFVNPSLRIRAVDDSDCPVRGFASLNDRLVDRFWLVDLGFESFKALHTQRAGHRAWYRLAHQVHLTSS